MNKVALIYATRMGQTAKIAEALKLELERRGCTVSLWNILKSKPQLDPSIDTVIYGSPIYAGQSSRKLSRWIRNHHPVLRQKQLAFFTVSLNHADTHASARFDDDRLLRAFISSSMIVPDFVASFSGRLAYTRYPKLIRWKMRQIAARAGGSVDTTRDHEYTEWAEVSRFAEAIVNRPEASKFNVDLRLKNLMLTHGAMPEFEHTLEASSELTGFSQDEVFRGLQSSLSSVRFLGLSPTAENFPTEILSTSVGRLAALRFQPDPGAKSDFAEFQSPGFVKILLSARTELAFEDDIRVTLTLRLHATDSRQRARARTCWPLIRLAFRLYQRQLFSQIREECFSGLIPSNAHVR